MLNACFLTCHRIAGGVKEEGEIVSTQTFEQCPYFEANTVTLPVPGEKPFVTLTVAKCHLAEEMRRRLNTLATGQEITKSLTTTPQGGETRMIYGPDMQPIAAAVCLIMRRDSHCEPHFVQTLNLLALEITLPQTPQAG